MPRFADLHIHTYYSDSTSSPQEVIDGAVKAELSCVSITDHDMIEGIAPTIEAGKAHGIEVVAGVELSSELSGADIHMLGYFFDHEDSPLVDKLEAFLDARLQRMKEMIMLLRGVGVNNIELEEVQALTKSRALGRPHLAKVLVDKGWVSNIKQAFDKYLAFGGIAYAPKFKMTPFEAIDLIVQSGGIAVMAHPMLTQKDELIPQFVRAGMKGLEVYYPNCMGSVTEFYERIAKKNGLIATGGSDSHGAAKVYTHVGKSTVPYETVEQMKKLVMC